MNDVYELKQQAHNLRKQKSFNQAIEIYKDLWENHSEDCDEWVGWGYAYSLRKIGDFANACQVSQQVCEKWPDFDYNQNLLALCIYDLEINKDNNEIQQNEPGFFEAVSRVLNLTKQDKYSPVCRTIFKVIDYLDDPHRKFPAEAINNWLDKLNQQELSLDTWQGKDHRGRPMEHASDREKWYAKKCKALYELGRYQECIDMGSEALENIPTFHYRNDKWIKRLLALSYSELDNPEEGINWLKQIIDDKAEWFLYFDMAVLLGKIGQADLALKFAARAALDRQELGFRCNVFAEMGKILLGIGEMELANKHLLLATKIRLENEWSIPSDLQELIDKANVEINEEVAAKALEKELRKYWQSLKFADLKIATGTIKNIVSAGKSGFILGEDGNEYYFRVNSFRGHPDQLQPGLRVSFHIQPTDQPGKKDTAVNLVLAK